MCETNNEKSFNKLINEMIDKISNKTNVFFKSQQKDETDLTFNEKRDIVQNVLNCNKELFLQRYGTHLSEEELNYFQQFNDNYSIDCVLNNLRKSLVKNKNKTIVKNRRYEAMQQLIKSGHYFSDSEMQTRNPLLFEQMVGQYMTTEEKTRLTNEKYSQNYESITFSSFLLEQIDRTDIENRLNAQEVEEFDLDSDDSDDNESEVLGINTKSLEETEKVELRSQFLKLMYEQFLCGKDSQYFDYNYCDSNTQFDNNPIDDRDQEDKYFEED